MDGFSVDVSALRTAAEGIRGSVEVVGSPIATIGADAGHDGLARALDGFLDRWQRGVESLTDDGRALSDHLDADERAYRAVEARAVDGVVRSTGPDPAAR